MKEDYPVLYVFVRTDLPSLGSSAGKMAAHSGHAANAFIHENVVGEYLFSNSNRPMQPEILEWMKSTKQGFGTHINLKASWQEVEAAVTEACALNNPSIKANYVIDPTYPYTVDSEIFDLLPPSLHSDTPINLGNGKFACFRWERTAAYIFGMKSQLVDIVGKFPLHP